MSDVKAFLDTNLFVYLYSDADTTKKDKKRYGRKAMRINKTSAKHTQANETIDDSKESRINEKEDY